MSCLCGCGTAVKAGREYVSGHNRRKPWTWTVEDCGYSTPCWIWDRPPGAKGYGTVRVAGRNTKAHRAVYEREVGPIPAGLELDHLCRVRLCVNPAHLEPVTTRENVLRSEAPTAQNARKTHCKRGHEFTPENTITRKGGNRGCRTCMRAYLANYYQTVTRAKADPSLSRGPSMRRAA